MTTVQIVANPAVTIGRAFTDTFAGIAPVSVLGFVVAQFVGLLAGVGLLLVLYPYVGNSADNIVVPNDPEDGPGRVMPAAVDDSRERTRHA